MAQKIMLVALSMIVATSPTAAAQPEHIPTSVAPAGTAETKYCMRVEAITGSRIERVKCWTREEWADQGVDVDEDWAKEGVAVVA